MGIVLDIPLDLFNIYKMIKDIIKYGFASTITALFCCVAPSILFAIGLGSGIFAFQFADFFYNTDGSANIYGWILRLLGLAIVGYGIFKYNKKESCSLNSNRQKAINKFTFTATLLILALGLYLLFTHLTTEYFEVIDITRQKEYLK